QGHRERDRRRPRRGCARGRMRMHPVAQGGLVQRHPISRSTVSTAILVLCAGVSLGCTDDGEPDSLCEPGSTDCLLSHTLFVAHEGLLSSYDIATGEERPGSVSGISAPVDLQALEDGSLIVNLTGT